MVFILSNRKIVCQNKKAHHEYFIEDILNFNMVFEDGEELGILTDVQNYGSSDVYFVQCKNKNISKLKEELETK